MKRTSKPSQRRSAPSAARPAEPADAADAPDLSDAPELDDAFFESAAVGRHYFEAMRGSNVVRIAPELLDQFPTERSVNDALRSLAELRRVPTHRPVPPPDTAEQRKRFT